MARRGFKLDVDKLGALEERRKYCRSKRKTCKRSVTPDRNPWPGESARGRYRAFTSGSEQMGEELDAAKAELDALQAEIRISR